MNDNYPPGMENDPRAPYNEDYDPISEWDEEDPNDRELPDDDVSIDL
tara:strand:+ start:656 stop:796 length:141 start_codon:yes stop_codon:yes gene_type:complete